MRANCSVGPSRMRSGQLQGWLREARKAESAVEKKGRDGGRDGGSGEGGDRGYRDDVDVNGDGRDV